jgi:hypothetical protein
LEDNRHSFLIKFHSENVQLARWRMSEIVLAAHPARPSLASPMARKLCGTKALPPNKKGRRSAERRNISWVRASGRGGASSGTRSPCGAPPRHSPAQSQPPLAQPQAAFPETRLCWVLPNSRPVSVQRAPRSSGPSAGRAVPRAARGRSVWLRARGPLSLRCREYLRDGVPFESTSEIMARSHKLRLKSIEKGRSAT